MLFGQGDRADFPVSGDGIAAVHFAIESDGQLVWVHRLADTTAPVLVNEKPVEKAELRNGDTVTAGNTKVRIQIQGRNRDKPVQKTPPPAPPRVATPQSQIVPRDLPTGLTMYHDPGLGTSLATVLELLQLRFAPLLIANFRLAGVNPPDWIAANDDLLAAAPAEVTDQHSLHLLAAEDIPLPDGNLSPLDSRGPQRAALLELYHQLRPHAAAILAFAKASKSDVTKSIGFRRGFYCSADSLEMFLARGSRELARSLVDGMHAILIARNGDLHWTLYANPTLAPTPAEVGLAAKPPVGEVG
jgi:hypothetical protein